MIITKRQERLLGEITKPLEDLIKSVVDCPTDQLPALLRKNLTWETSRGSLLNWVAVLNKFDSIFEEVTAKYKLTEKECKPIVFTPQETDVLTAVLDFTHMLLENSTHKGVYASSHRLFDLLNSPTVPVCIRAIKCLIVLAKRFSGLKYMSRWNPFHSKLNNQIIAYTRLMPASTLTANTGTSDNLSLIDFIKENPQVPQKWKKLEYLYYPADDGSNNQSLPSLSQSAVESSPSISRVRNSQTSASPSPKKKKQHRAVKGDKIETLVMSEETVRKLSLQQIFDMGSEKVAPSYWLRFGLEATVTKAFNNNSYENIKLRHELVELKCLAVAFKVLVSNDVDVTAKVLEADPTLLSSLIDLVNLYNNVPREVRLAACLALECFATKKTLPSDIVRGMGGSVPHGLVFQNLRLIIKQLRANKGDDIFEDFNLSFFNLLANLIATKALAGILVSAGLIQHLTEFVNLPTDFKRSTAAAIHLLELVVSNNSDHIATFRENNGYQSLIEAVGSEIEFALANPGYGGGPPKITVVHYSISYRQANLLRAMLTFAQHLIQKETGDRVRNLFDSPLLQHINKILLNPTVFGYTLLTLSIGIVSSIIHNEPTSYPILKEAGTVDIFINNFETFFGKSADLLLSLPTCIGGLALNNEGLQKILDAKLIQKLFTVFDNKDFAKSLVQDDSSEFLGTAIDELARHYPQFKPVIEAEMVALVGRLPHTGGDILPRPHIYQSEKGAFYHSKDEEVVDYEYGASQLDTWESIEEAYVLENAAVSLGNSIEFSNSWTSLTDKVPFQQWLKLVTLKNSPFDYVYSNALYPINGSLKYFDDEKRDYAPRILIDEMSNVIGDLENDYLVYSGEKSIFQELEGQFDKADDLLNRLIAANNLLFTFVDVYCNPASLSSTRLAQFSKFFADEKGVELLRRLGKLLKRVTSEEYALLNSMPASAAVETMITEYDEDFPPLRIYRQEPQKDVKNKHDKTSAKFKNSCQIRVIGHRIHSSIAIMFNTLLMLPAGSRQEPHIDSHRGAAVRVCHEITTVLADLVDTSNFGKPGYYLILLYTAHYCLTDPTSDKMLTIPATMFLQFGGFLKLKDGLLHFWRRMVELEIIKISEMKDLTYVIDTEESIFVAIVMNLLLALNKSTLFENMTSVSDSSVYYEGALNGSSTINTSSLGAAFTVQTKLLGFGILERVLDEEVFGSFEEDKNIVPNVVIAEVMKLCKHVYLNTGVRNLNQSDGTLFEIDWTRVRHSRARVEYLMSLGLDEASATKFMEKTKGSLTELFSEETIPEVCSATKWSEIHEAAQQKPYEIVPPKLVAPQFEHFHTLVQLQDVRQMKQSFIMDQTLLICQLYPKMTNTIGDFLMSCFLGVGKAKVESFEEDVLNTILEFIYSFEFTEDDSKSLTCMLRLFSTLLKHETIFFGAHASLENFIPFIVETVRPEHVNCDWFEPAMTVLKITITKSSLPELGKPEVPFSWKAAPSLPVSYKVPEEQMDALLDTLLAIPEITKPQSVHPLCDALVIFAAEPVKALRIAKSGVVQKILKMMANAELRQSEELPLLQSSFVHLVRRCSETKATVRDIIAREIQRYYQNKNKGKARDLTSVLRDLGGVAMRSPDVFLEEFCKRVQLVEFNESSLKSLMTKYLAVSDEDVSMADVADKPPSAPGADPATPLEDQTGIVHILLTELMSTAKKDWLSEPELTSAEKEALEKENKKSEVPKPPKMDPAKNENCAHMMFLLKVITELLASYKQCKLEFLTFSKKQLFQPSLDETPKPRSTSMNFFLHQLVLVGDVEPSEPVAIRRKAMNELAQGVILAFVSTVESKDFKADAKKVDPDMTFIRKFAVDAIHRAIKESMNIPASLKATTLKLSMLCKLLAFLLKPVRAKFLDTSSTEFDTFHMANTIMDGNVPTTLTSILSDLDINFPGHEVLLDNALHVLNDLAMLKVSHQELFKSLNPSSGADEEEVEENENDFKEETPDLFQNSTLGMYDVGEIDTEEEDDVSDEELSFDEEDEEDEEEDEDEDDIMLDIDGQRNIVYSEEEDMDNDGMIGSDEGEIVDSGSESGSESGESDEEMDSGSDSGDDYVRYDIVPDIEFIEEVVDDGDDEGDEEDEDVEHYSFDEDEDDQSSLYGSDIDATLAQFEESERRPARGLPPGVITVDLDNDLDRARDGLRVGEDTGMMYSEDESSISDYENGEPMSTSLPALLEAARMVARDGGRRHVRIGHREHHAHLLPQRFSNQLFGRGGNERSRNNLETYYNLFSCDFPPNSRHRMIPEFKIMSTHERLHSLLSNVYTRNDGLRLMYSIVNNIYASSLEAYKVRMKEEEERRQAKKEEAKKQKAERRERRRQEEEERANAAAAAAATEEGGEAPVPAEAEREPVWVMIGDRRVDISGTDIDPEFFEALPDDMREEVFTQHIRERRAQAAQEGGDTREIDPDFLDALPDSIREEILAQEMAVQRGRDLARIFGGRGADDDEDESDAPPAAGDTTELVQPKKEEKQKVFFTPLIEKSRIASLVRFVFAPRSFFGRRLLFNVLGQICINKQSRAEVLGLLLAILQDGLGSQESLEKVFAQLSLRCKPAPSTSVSSKLSSTPRTPNTPTKTNNTSTPFPNRAAPFTIACQVLEALQFLLESDPQLRYYFLTEHESVTLVKKPSSMKKPHLSKPSKYPLNTLLGLLEYPIVKEKSVLMDLLSRIIQITTRPLTAMKSAQDANKDMKKKIELPNIVGGALKNVVTILVSDDCSSRTFQQTLSAMQNLLVVKSHNVFSNELSRHATKLAGLLVKDLNVMAGHLKENGEDAHDFDAAVMLKFTSSSSDQSKLLRVLTALDYLFGKNKEAESGENKELTRLYNNLSLGELWGSLSDCLDLFEENKNITHIATTLLPLIEALMVVCKHSKVKEVQAKDALKYESSKCDFKNEKIENLFFSFTNKHKKILNQMVRSNAKLMSGPFAMLVKNPKILEFDNKKNYLDRQLHSKETAKNTLAVSVRRDQVFLDSYRALFFKPKEEFRNAKLDINFKGEAGVDAGGVTREWYQVLSRQMFNPDYALFLPVASDKTTFHPNRTSWVNPEHLSFFKFIGRIIGKAIFDGCFLDCHFSRDVYKSILGRAVSLKDLETIDLEYYKSLMWMLENDITDIIIETFSVETDDYGEVKVIDLVPNGRNISVTEENKHEYVRLVVEYRLQKSVKEQMDNFLQGFHEVIPKELIGIFDEQELELLISGLPDIDVDDWKNNTTYVNYNSNSKEIGYFWRAVRSFDEEERAKLLQFATGTSKVPLNGFKELEGANGPTRFSIHKDFGATDRLPSSHTCFNQIDLPAYDSYEMLRKALLLAITEGHEGFGLA